jgi:hypothetical protein
MGSDAVIHTAVRGNVTDLKKEVVKREPIREDVWNAFVY